jgi:hypothetical protein
MALIHEESAGVIPVEGRSEMKRQYAKQNGAWEQISENTKFQAT